MSKTGIKAAVTRGVALPSFADQPEAENVLFALRDKAIQYILSRAKQNPSVDLDFSVESLLRLETWYFKVISTGRIFSFFNRRSRYTLPQACAFYFGEVVVRNRAKAKWVVEEFPFVKGRYEIGVNEGLSTMMLSSFHTKLHHPENKKHNSLWRTYQHYFERNPKVTITF
jgi:hypothetical protein